MFYLLVFLFIVISFGISFPSYNADYLTKRKTNAIKGVFACLILFSHLRGYLKISDFDVATIIYDSFMGSLGQLIVVVFLFYSGYGIMEQYSAKGYDYIDSFLQKRVLKTWLHFSMAVFLFLIVQTIIGNRFEFHDYCLCWFGWTSIGNSNWFVFDILVLYLITFFVLTVSKYYSLPKSYLVILLFVETLLFWFFLYSYKNGNTWWYNTVLVYPFGALYSCIRQGLDKWLIALHFHSRLFIVIMVFIVFLSWRLYAGIDVYGICSVLFMFCILGITSIVSIDNAILQWLGNHSFSIYILQRLPMILLRHIGVSQQVLFIIGAITLTLLLAYFFNIVVKRVDMFIFPQ